MTKLLDRELLHILMEINIEVNFKMDINTGKDIILIMTKIDIKENGVKMRKMDKDKWFLIIKIDMMVNF